MIHVTFRFYAQLNDFLPARYRQRRFSRVLPARASVKDTIEALGVPHPEVDLVVVNGQPQTFAYVVADGDTVAAYPVFRAIGLGGLTRVGTSPPSPLRFVLDVHLGKLAALLRLAGFDAIVRADDEELARISGREGRVALTRDVGLLKRSIVVHGHWVRHTEPERQLLEIVERFDLVDLMAPFTRCLRCNGLLLDVRADEIADRLPLRTGRSFDRFRRCPDCGRVYWQGSHYARLERLIERVRAAHHRASGHR